MSKAAAKGFDEIDEIIPLNPFLQICLNLVFRHHVLRPDNGTSQRRFHTILRKRDPSPKRATVILFRIHSITQHAHRVVPVPPLYHERREALVEELAERMWVSHRDREIDPDKWENAGPYWQMAMREFAQATLDMLSHR